jgi:TetR/AcrR family transcriptional regulator, cholesterol catabolism regulator
MAAHRRIRRLSSLPARPLAGRRERRKADIRGRLFRAAFEQFGARGFTATTVEDITVAADVAKGTFFNYFPTKEHLLMEFSELRLEIIRGALAEVRRGALPIRDVLRGMFFALMKEPGRSRAMARCMLLGALGGEPVAGIVQKKLAEGRGALAEAMMIGQRRGEIRADWRPDDLARLFQQSVFGSMHMWVLHPGLDVKRVLETTFALYWAAIQPVSRSRKKA